MRIYFIVVLICNLSYAVAQGVVGGVQSKGMDMNAQAYGFVTEIKKETKEVKGSFYLYEDWSLGNVDFVNGAKLENKEIRYNIESDVLELKLDGENKESKSRFVNAFDIYNLKKSREEHYVKASEFTIQGIKLVGFLRLILQGNEFSLYSRVEVKVVEGSYVAALDMGNEDDEISRKESFFLEKNGELIEFSGSKKKFCNTLEYGDKILARIKKDKLSFKNEEDLVSIVGFINTLY